MRAYNQTEIIVQIRMTKSSFSAGHCLPPYSCCHLSFVPRHKQGGKRINEVTPISPITAVLQVRQERDPQRNPSQTIDSNISIHT